MYGTGTYFADNSAYSDGYAHVSDLRIENKQVKQVLLAFVIEGESVSLLSDSSLTRPPQKT